MKKYLLLLLLFLLSGCVYYNTFYNAEKYFAEAQEMELQDDGKPEANAIQNYNNTIKKCGMVLEYYKGSKYSDDAVFLMAKSFFYIGRNYTQAISKFEDLIKFYPESEFFPEANLYLARANYRFKKKQEAFEMLQTFLLNKDFIELHPQALKVLANYNLEEENYIESEYYLKKIIEEYPQSDEYENAYFLRGKTQSEAQNFEKSNEIFLSLLETKIKKSVKLDARYFIGYNYLQLEEYPEAKEITKKILNDEYRESKISKIQMILARTYANLEETDEAIELFNVIMNDNKRSRLSAEAAFYLGELYFDVLKDYEKAIESYNKVNTEFRSSEFVQQALTRSSVASQIVQYHNPDKNIIMKDLILQHFKLAEYYIDILDQPDSAIVVYNKIFARESSIKLRADSLGQRLAVINAIIDSSIIIFETVETKEDSLEFEENYGEKLASASNDKRELNTIKNNLDEVLKLYNEEFVPYAKFVMIWIYNNVKQDSSKVDLIYSEILNDFPLNKYTYAAQKLLSGEKVVISTAADLKEIATYEDALSYFSSQPEKTIEILLPISENVESKLSENARYVMGYLYYFSLSDSTASKIYLDDILQNSDNVELRRAVGVFYANSIFKKLDRLPAIEELENRKKRAEQEKESKEKESEEKKKEKTDEKSKEKLKKELERTPVDPSAGKT